MKWTAQDHHFIPSTDRRIVIRMWPTTRNTPMQLAKTAVVANGLYIGLLLLASFVPMPHRTSLFNPGHAWQTVTVRIIVSCLVILPGTLLLLRSLKVLRKGIRENRWSEEQIDSLRVQLDRPLWNVLRWSTLALVALSFIVLPEHSLIVIGFYFFLIPFGTLSELRAALNKPVSRTPRTIDWSTAKPLQSDSWGSPKAG